MVSYIILDTNFLLVPVQFKVDIFDELARICLVPHTLAIVVQTRDELTNIIATQKGVNRQAAKIALELLEKKNVVVLSMEGCTHVDDALLAWGQKGAIIATQDKDLKRKLKFHGVRCIVLRKKSHLVLEGDSPCITKRK